MGYIQSPFTPARVSVCVVGTSRCDVRAACSGASPLNTSVAGIFVSPAIPRAGTGRRAIPAITLNRCRPGPGCGEENVRRSADRDVLKILLRPKSLAPAPAPLRIRRRERRPIQARLINQVVVNVHEESRCLMPQMSYRSRESPGDKLADWLGKTERLAAVSSIRFVIR